NGDVISDPVERTFRPRDGRSYGLRHTRTGTPRWFGARGRSHWSFRIHLPLRARTVQLRAESAVRSRIGTALRGREFLNPAHGGRICRTLQRSDIVESRSECGLGENYPS